MNESTDNGVQPVQEDGIQSNAHLSTPEPAKVEADNIDAAETQPDGDKKPDGDSSDKKARNRPGREERESYRLQQENAQLRARLEQKSNGQTPQTQNDNGKPKLEDFDDAIAWSEANAQWAAEQAVKSYESKLTQQAEQRQIQELIASHEEREAVFEETVPDYEQKVTAVLQSGLVTPDIQMAVLHSEMSPEIAYHFSTEGGINDLRILNSLQANPQALRAAIGQIEAYLKSTPVQAAVKKTSAPQPISPVKGQAPSSTKSLDEMDYDDFVKEREKSLRR